MSDTPISDSTPHNVAELGMLCRRLERELDAANERIKRLEEDLMDAKNKHAALVADVALYEDRGERIKRLKEALESILEYWNRDNNNRAMVDACWYAIDTASEALEAKEAKL
jgi:DNA repair exonuclease SbcCD ATPase subunit